MLCTALKWVTDADQFPIALRRVKYGKPRFSHLVCFLIQSERCNALKSLTKRSRAPGKSLFFSQRTHQIFGGNKPGRNHFIGRATCTSSSGIFRLVLTLAMISTASSRRMCDQFSSSSSLALIVSPAKSVNSYVSQRRCLVKRP